MMNYTAQSVTLYDKNGKRKINLDLKDIQEKEFVKELIEKYDNDLIVVGMGKVVDK